MRFIPLVNITVSPPDFEADLQEVWSVKKNIHHTGGQKNISSSNSSNLLLNGSPAQVTAAAQYSRHGAIPAQPTRGPQVLQPANNRDQFGRGTVCFTDVLEC